MDVVFTETAENKSLVYSGTKAILQPSTGRGNLQGQETCSFEQAHVEFPSCWDLNATIVESKIERELSNAHQTNTIQMPNNLYQITSAKYQMLNNCETHDLSNEESLKHENTKEQSESVTVPEQYSDTSIRKPEFQNGFLLQTSSKFKFECCGNSQFSNVLDNKKIQLHVRNSRAVVVSHLRMRRGREPSRISFGMVTTLFKRRKTRKLVKLYIKKYVPPSSMLKVMPCKYTRNHFFDQCRRSKFTVFPKKCFITRKLHLFAFRLRTFKHKKSPSFCIYTENNSYKKLRQLHHVKTCHLFSRIITFSGDVELNPEPASEQSCDLLYTCSSLSHTCMNPSSLLETRLSRVRRPAIDVGGRGDCFFRAVSHQLYGNSSNHFYVRSVGVQYLVHNPEQFIESNIEHSWQDYLQRMSNQGTWADAIII